MTKRVSAYSHSKRFTFCHHSFGLPIVHRGTEKDCQTKNTCDERWQTVKRKWQNKTAERKNAQKTNNFVVEVITILYCKLSFFVLFASFADFFFFLIFIIYIFFLSAFIISTKHSIKFTLRKIVANSISCFNLFVYYKYY